ncbi:MAG: hypothetical protein U0414_04720 [Polyangiaceae bacterium]
MPTSELTHDVVELLRERLHGFEAVEVLLVLHADPRTWRVTEIGDRLSADRDVVRAALEELRRGGFVVQEPDGRWRYAPTDAATAAAVTNLVRVYATARFEVLRQMSENALERIRSSAATAFADAFRFGKGRKDG